MNTYLRERKNLAKISAKIKSLNHDIDVISMTAEIREAIQNDNMTRYKELREVVNAREDQLNSMYNTLYRLEIKRTVIRDNCRHALFNDAYPVIVKAFEPYNGKQYGDRTREKIREEVKKHGFYFWFDGYENNRINIEALDNFTVKGVNDVYAYAVSLDTDGGKHNGSFITSDNTINVSNVTASMSGSYVEDVNARVNEIMRALRAFYKAQDLREKARNELTAVLPYGVKDPDYVPEYKLTF